MQNNILRVLSLTLTVIFLITGCSQTKQVENDKKVIQNGTTGSSSSASSQNETSEKVSTNTSNPGTSSNTNSNSNSTNNNTNDKLSFFYGTFQLAVPGVSYSTENKAQNTVTVNTSTGVQSGGIKINPDGTYIWNSTWDEKIINGKWKETGESDYPILILKGEEGKNWKLGKSNQSGSDIFVWDTSSIWKIGKKVK